MVHESEVANTNTAENPLAVMPSHLSRIPFDHVILVCCQLCVSFAPTKQQQKNEITIGQNFQFCL